MSALPPALVVINPAARHGRGGTLYAGVREAVASRFTPCEVELDRTGLWRHALTEALSRGTRSFIAAGGDGTVNAVTSELAARRVSWPLEDVRLGAVGLGSSNDFHKPVRAALGSVPLRLDVDGSTPRDVGRAIVVNGAGERQEHCFIVSASLGVTAHANALFNRSSPALTLVRRHWLDGAILLAAISAIVHHRNLRARVRVGGEEHACALSSLSILKTPHLSGTLRFDTPVAADDGLLAVNLCQDMGHLRLVATLAGLLRGRFAGRPGTRCWRVPMVEVVLGGEADLELDGEVVPARQIAFDVLPERIRVCA
jgi:diacylglycerol kinase (ATP)